MKAIRNDPIIYTIDNFISEKHCNHIIELARPNIKHALVSGDKAGYVSYGRSGKNCWIKHDTDIVTKLLSERISNLLNIPLENSEQIQIIYYDKDQEYRQHYDGWDFDGSEKSRRNMKYGGQRMVTALAYLNTVPKGGGTRFTKLDIEVNAEIGKLLVFHNTINDSNEKHPLSEHAGMPVIEGEKWAFNFWFREKSRKVEYKYPEIISSKNNIPNLCSIKVLNENKVDLNIDLANLDNLYNYEKEEKKETERETLKINLEKEFLDKKEIEQLLNLSKFDEEKEKSQFWINNNSISKIINKISELVNIKESYFENACLTRYKNEIIHRDHQDAYDLNSDKGKEYIKLLGQRLLTISIFFSPTVIKFPKINQEFKCDKGTIIYYNNCFNNRNIRNQNMIKSYQGIKQNEENEENEENENIILNIYVRERLRSNKEYLKICNQKREYIECSPPLLNKIENIIENKSIENENIQKISLDYEKILENIYNKSLEETLRDRDFKMINNAPTKYINDTLNSIYDLKIENKFLNQENLNAEYFIDEFNPVIVENVISPEIHEIINNYFKENIKNGVYPLGDRQANRYKVIDEIITRLMHLEFLPLIERIIGKKMELTYTYLSAYLKGTSLPPHTDRPECEFTCSYIIGKPPESSWNIYLHKTKQPIKYKGRYDFTPPKEECIPVDVGENGLMIFNGTDHIHFREKLEHDYYNVVLLHYCSK